MKTYRGDGFIDRGKRGEGVVSIVFGEGVVRRREVRGISNSRMFSLDFLWTRF